MMIVDEYCNVRDAKIYSSYQGESWYCTLNQTNIANNNNKFYIMQLLSSGNSFLLYTRYGRVGDKGIAGVEQFSSEFHAIKKFVQKFRSKTGSTWYDVRASSYTPITGKYFVMDTVTPEVKKVKPLPSSSLPPPVEEMIKAISDSKEMVTVMKSFDVDTKRLPLGKISSEQINKGYELLHEIKDWVEGEFKSLKEMGIEDVDEFRDLTLMELSSEFWSFIPYACGRNKPPVIRTKEDIERYGEMLDILENIKIAGSVIEQGAHPDDIYQKIGLDINVVPPDSEEGRILLKYVANTTGQHGYQPEVLEIFSLNDNQKTLDLGNKKLLFHGSRTANYVGILSDGLRIPAITQVANGSVLGRGIYFADCITKSFNYCRVLKGGVGYIVVCEVLLGDNPHVVTRATFDDTLNSEYTSRWARGKNTPNPSQFETINGVTVPCGELIPTGIDSGFIYNEYVVYRPDVYKFRYLLKIKMA